MKANDYYTKILFKKNVHVLKNKIILSLHLFFCYKNIGPLEKTFLEQMQVTRKQILLRITIRNVLK